MTSTAEQQKLKRIRELNKLYKQQQQLEQYRANQEKFDLQNSANKINNTSLKVDKTGKALSKYGKNLSGSNNQFLSNLGNGMQGVGDGMQNYSGQEQVQSLKNNMFNSVKNGIGNAGSRMAGSNNQLVSNIGSRLSGMGASGGATTAGTAGATAGTTAGTTAATTAGAAGAAEAGTAAGASATGAAGAGAAGAGASGAGAGTAAAGASAAVPAIGWGIAAAALIHQMISSAQKKKQAKAMQASAQEIQNSMGEAQESKSDAMQNLAQQQQESLAALQQQNGADVLQGIGQDSQKQNNQGLIAQEILSQIQQPSNGIGQYGADNTTGGAAPAVLADNQYQQENTPSLPHDGSATQELDNQSQKDSIMNMVKSLGGNVAGNISDGVSDFVAGFQDNAQTGFREGDLYNQLNKKDIEPSATEDGTMTGSASETKKDIMNRLGELAGTGSRAMSNPWVQAGIAALTTKTTGGDWGDSLNNAYKYGTAKATSNYYADKLGKPRNALQNYTKDDYAAEALADYRNVMADNNVNRVNYQAYAKRATDLSNMLDRGMITNDQYLAAMKKLNSNYANEGYAVGVGNAQASNNTRKVNETIRSNKVKEGIQQQNANTNTGRLAETQRHNGVAESVAEKNTAIAQEKWNAKQAANRQKVIDKEVQTGTKILMKAPNGETVVADPNDEKELEKQGCKRIN